MARRGIMRPLVVLGWLLAALPAFAMESAPIASKGAIATLVSDSDSVGSDGTVRLGLRLKLAPGWHTYWRNPGDAGVPAELTFTLPAGATASPVSWPTPQRQAEGPITTFAYTGEVLLPVTVTAPKGEGLPVALQASWLVCENVCVPEAGRFTLELPAAGSTSATPSAEAPLFAAAKTRTPLPSPWPARIDPAGVLHVTGPELGPATVREAWFAAAEQGRLDLMQPQTLSVANGGLALTLKPSAPGPLAGVLVLRDPTGRDSAFDLVAAPGSSPTPASSAAAPVARLLTPWAAIGAALLGGLLLNVMPCVFPVLAMKAAGLAGGERERARQLAASYLLGTVATFCALGLALVALRRAGALVGWGFQFQSPAFVAGAAFLIFLMGLNLSGVFAVGAARLTGAGSGLTRRGGHVGSAATGALAVLVATPCTAPFMGAAITAALAAPTAMAMGVFFALGLGLALPYVALAWLPDLGRKLPRPGLWMERLRQALAFPMYLTVAWLAWVLAQQTGADGVLLLAVGCTALGFCAWLLGLSQRGRRLGGLPFVASAGVVAVFASVATLRPVASAAGADTFSLARLDALRAEGRPVFVDMTAAWCVTCLVNERVALAPGDVRAAFDRRGVVLLRGDWTRQDPAISRFLREHGSDGVPLYVFYPSGGRDPVVLPQILTPGIVIDALSA